MKNLRVRGTHVVYTEGGDSVSYSWIARIVAAEAGTATEIFFRDGDREFSEATPKCWQTALEYAERNAGRASQMFEPWKALIDENGDFVDESWNDPPPPQASSFDAEAFRHEVAERVSREVLDSYKQKGKL